MVLEIENKGEMQKEMQVMELGEEEEEEVVVRGRGGSNSKCRDCGNQAKKECSYSRCRTCCKNKGFQCQTHIKSTWTPVDRRRERKTTTSLHHFHPHNIIPHNSGLDLKFPDTVNSMAVFRCVEVRSMDDAVNEIAYQTSVNIGGHIFSGLLYDQGPDQQSYNININRGDSSTGSLVDHQQNTTPGLINAPSIHSTRDINTANIATMASNPHDEPWFSTPSYPFPFAPFRPGMPYFSYPKPS